MRLSEKQQIFTKNVAKLIAFASEKGIGLTFGHAYRSHEEQQRLYREGKTKMLMSNHNRRLAIDFNYFIDGRLTYDWYAIKVLGDYWESLHPANRWGGDWNKNNRKDGFIDVPHFEMNI